MWGDGKGGEAGEVWVLALLEVLGVLAGLTLRERLASASSRPSLWQRSVSALALESFELSSSSCALSCSFVALSSLSSLLSSTYLVFETARLRSSPFSF